jgi:hypothetical protein
LLLIFRFSAAARAWAFKLPSCFACFFSSARANSGGCISALQEARNTRNYVQIDKHAGARARKLEDGGSSLVQLEGVDNHLRKKTSGLNSGINVA